MKASVTSQAALFPAQDKDRRVSAAAACAWVRGKLAALTTVEPQHRRAAHAIVKAAGADNEER